MFGPGRETRPAEPTEGLPISRETFGPSECCGRETTTQRSGSAGASPSPTDPGYSPLVGVTFSVIFFPSRSSSTGAVSPGSTWPAAW